MVQGLGIRTVVRVGGREALDEGRRLADALRAKVRRARRRGKTAVYNRQRRLADPVGERERKKQWRRENPEHVRAYYRTYDATTPGRREYKAAWLRNARARERAAANG